MFTSADLIRATIVVNPTQLFSQAVETACLDTATVRNLFGGYPFTPVKGIFYNLGLMMRTAFI